MSRSHLSLLGLAAFTASVLVSCGPKDADKVGAAQLCIDEADKTTVADCLTDIESIDTKPANLLRCSAGFIEEGFTEPSRFQAAFDALSTSGSQSTETFLGHISFTSKASKADNQAFVNKTFTSCEKSGAKGFILLGSMAKTGTTLTGLLNGGAGVGQGTTPTGADLEAILTNAQSDPATKEAVGSAVAATYVASCQTGQKANTELCTQLDSALSGVNMSDSNAVGNAVLDYWKNH